MFHFPHLVVGQAAIDPNALNLEEHSNDFEKKLQTLQAENTSLTTAVGTLKKDVATLEHLVKERFDATDGKAASDLLSRLHQNLDNIGAVSEYW